MVYEKQQKRSIMIKMHGLGDRPYWMHYVDLMLFLVYYIDQVYSSGSGRIGVGRGYWGFLFIIKNSRVNVLLVQVVRWNEQYPISKVTHKMNFQDIK